MFCVCLARNLFELRSRATEVCLLFFFEGDLMNTVMEVSSTAATIFLRSKFNSAKRKGKKKEVPRKDTS